MIRQIHIRLDMRAIAFTRTLVALVALLLDCHLPEQACGQERHAQVQSSDIAREYAHKSQKIQNLLVNYNEAISPIMSIESLFRIGMFDFPESAVTVCKAGQKEYLRSLTKRRQLDQLLKQMKHIDPSIADFKDMLTKASAKEFLRVVAQQPFVTAETIYVFDGESLRQKTPSSLATSGTKHPVYNVLPLSSDRRGHPIGRTYMEFIGFGIKADSDFTDDFSIAFAQSDVIVLAGSDLVEGSKCVVVKCPGKQEVWLDINKGFAVRKRDLYSSAGLYLTVDYSDHVEIVPNVWIPKSVRKQ